jgi:hypothetical protein
MVTDRYTWVMGGDTSLSTNQPGQPDVAFGLEGGDGVVGHLLCLDDPGMVVGDLLGQTQGVVL